MKTVKNDALEATGVQPRLRAYQTPSLVVYGEVRKLTNASTMGSGENPGSMVTVMA